MKRVITLFLSIIMLLSFSVSAFASTAAQPNNVCSLEVIYRSGYAAFEGLDVSIWQVCVLTEDLKYEVHEDFNKYSVNLSELKTPAELNSAAQTLYACIVADKIPGIYAKTGFDGKAKFDELSQGMYLVSPVNTGDIYFSAMLIAVPNLDISGFWIYDVKSQPKPGTEPPPASDKDTEYRVTKLWRDSGSESQRPESVTVETYKDGILAETVILNSENNWTYIWTAPNDGGLWTVVERDVPPGYSMTLTQNEFSFLIENTKDSPSENPDIPNDPETPDKPDRPEKPRDPNVPDTGDSNSVTPYFVLLLCSVLGIITLLFIRKKEQAE